jgi:hypothetical protein
MRTYQGAEMIDGIEEKAQLWGRKASSKDMHNKFARWRNSMINVHGAMAVFVLIILKNRKCVGKRDFWG